MNSQVPCAAFRLCRFGVARIFVVSAACFCIALSAPPTQAQNFDASGMRGPIDLQGLWLVHEGDDPAYARPDFDDSQWTRVDSRSSLKTVLPDNGPQVIWYRLHVNVEPKQTDLALAECDISRAFEVFVNGQRIMQSGQVLPYIPNTLSARLLGPISNQQVATGALNISLRVHAFQSVRGSQEDFDPIPIEPELMLGKERLLWEHIWLNVIGQKAPTFMVQLCGLGIGIVALALFTAQRDHFEYLWAFLHFFFSASRFSLSLFAAFHNVSTRWGAFDTILEIAGSFFAVLMYFSFLRLRVGSWIRALIAAVSVGIIFILISPVGNFGLFGEAIAAFPLMILLAGVIPILIFINLRRGNREAGILLIPVILSCIDTHSTILLGFLASLEEQGLPTAAASSRLQTFLYHWPAGPFVLGLDQFADLLSVLSLAIIIVLRSTRISGKQAFLEGELAAAREVQQGLLPEQIENIPGFKVESAYLPAQQVGGDFFQVLPIGEDGLWVVIGDVAGKGLPAAMQVSALVGTIREVADSVQTPVDLLVILNERLFGRTKGGFSTALAAHIAGNGWVTIANAGHLSPYLDGREVELPGALPLGILREASYQVTQFCLAPGSRLTFYSDGVVEAQGPKGELFGFDRAKAISTRPAASIAEAAKQFGQEDDITVVTIERVAIAEEPAALRSAPILVPL